MATGLCRAGVSGLVLWHLEFLLCKLSPQKPTTSAGLMWSFVGKWGKDTSLTHYGSGTASRELEMLQKWNSEESEECSQGWPWEYRALRLCRNFEKCFGVNSHLSDQSWYTAFTWHFIIHKTFSQILCYLYLHSVWQSSQVIYPRPPVCQLELKSDLWTGIQICYYITPGFCRFNS